MGDRNGLEFGSRLGDQSAWFIENRQFERLWTGQALVFALIDGNALENFRKTSKVPPILLGKEGRRALITNRPEHL